MVLLFARPLFAVVALLVLSCPVTGQDVLSTGENASELADTSLSPDCRVPGLKLYTLAQLRGVRAALDEKRPLKVLAVGPSGTGGVGLGSASATYPSRLEEELEKRFSGSDIVVEHRILPGDITADAIERFTALVTEIEPNPVVWQVGTDDALAKADVEAFTGALAEILEWLNQHDIDAVLVEPPYNSAPVTDEHYTALRATIRNRASPEWSACCLTVRGTTISFAAEVRSCDKPVPAQRTWLQVHGRARCTHDKPLQPAPLEIGPAK